MKGFLKFGVLALVLVLVSGCGNGSKGKVLTCTRSEKEDSMSMTMTMKATFEDDKATKLSMDGEIVVGDDMASYVETLKGVFDSQFTPYASKDGVKYDSKVKDKTISYSLEIDKSKVSEDDLKEMDMDLSEGSYDEAKESLEKDGWTCK